jgi:hypothetical protein
MVSHRDPQVEADLHHCKKSIEFYHLACRKKLTCDELGP